jgi:hypothetical protein
MQGAEGIAQRLFEEFENSRAGSPFRSKVLEMMVAMCTRNTTEKEAVDVSQLDEKELLDLLAGIVPEDAVEGSDDDS